MPRRLLVGASLFVAAALIAYGGGDDGPDGSLTPGASATKPSAEASPTAPPGGAVADEAVAFGTSDGVTIRGHL